MNGESRANGGQMGLSEAVRVIEYACKVANDAAMHQVALGRRTLSVKELMKAEDACRIVVDALVGSPAGAAAALSDAGAKVTA